jgi:tyrosine-protein kinase Etk/Wzc
MNEKEINWVDLFKLIPKSKKMLASILIAGFVLVTFYNIIATPLYKSEVTLMPLSGDQNDSLRMISNSGTLQMLTGFVGNISTKMYSDKFMNILKSRTVSERVINSTNLLPKLFPKEWDDKNLRWKKPAKLPLLASNGIDMMLKEIAKVRETSEGLIRLTVIFEDPGLAQAIAEQYVAELQNFINQNTLTLAKKNRIFLEQQIVNKKVELAKAEEDLQKFQSENKLVSLDTQAEMTVRTSANLKAEILSREYQLAMLKKSSGLGNMEAQRISDEIYELKKQLSNIESGISMKDSLSNKKPMFKSIATLADLEVQYVRLKRDALVLEKVYELLNQQYELAKIEEVKGEVSFQIIDRANYPVKKYKPKVLINTFLALIGSFLVGLTVIFMKQSFNARPKD